MTTWLPRARPGAVHAGCATLEDVGYQENPDGWKRLEVRR